MCTDESKARCYFNTHAKTVREKYQAINHYLAWLRRNGMTHFHATFLTTEHLTWSQRYSAIYDMLRRDFLGEYEVVDNI